MTPSYSNKKLFRAYRAMDRIDDEGVQVAIDEIFAKCVTTKSFRPLTEAYNAKDGELRRLQDNFIERNIPNVDHKDDDAMERAYDKAHYMVTRKPDGHRLSELSCSLSQAIEALKNMKSVPDRGE